MTADRWRAGLLPAAICVAGLVVSVASMMPRAVAGRPATLIVAPGEAATVLSRLIVVDPEIRLLGRTLGGLGIVVVYQRIDFPAHLRETGALLMLGDGWGWCH